MKLNDKACKAAKPQAKQYKLADGQGLYLLVMPNGSKYWRYKYRFNNKENALPLGVYPDVSLAQARDRRSKARDVLNSGIDPALQKKSMKYGAIADAQNTFSKVAFEWHETKKSGLTKGYAELIWRNLERDIFPHIGNTPLKEISSVMLLNIIKKIENRGAPEISRRVLGVCAQIFKYAKISGMIDNNPASDISSNLKPRRHRHHAALEIQYIPDFIKALNKNDQRLFRQTILATKLLMLTFVRTGELIKAKWSEFDMDKRRWVIPAHRMKMRREHIVPLSTQVIEILNELRASYPNSEWVLPSINGHLKHISNNTILKAIERMGYKGRMTGHGFRALALTNICENLGYSPEIPDCQLAHTIKNKVLAAYYRSKYLPQRTKMMQDWADYLDKITQSIHVP